MTAMNSGDELPPTASQATRTMPRFGDPLSWSVPIMRLGGTTVRVHALLLATIVVLLMRAGWFAGDIGFFLGPIPAAIFLSGLCGVVFIHETANLIVLRRLGGDLPEIILQPLGGLENGISPPDWRSTLVAAMTGPMVTMLCVLFAIIALYLGSGTILIPDPFTFSGVYSPGVAESAWLESVYLVGIAAMLVSVANLLPVAPFRGQLILEAILRPRLGPAASRRATHRVGIATAILLAGAGVLSLQLVLVLIAMLSATMLQREHQRFREIGEVVGGSDSQVVDIRLDAILDQQEAAEQDAAAARAAIRRSEAQANEEALLNQILEKIARQGIEALDANERKLLEAATTRQRAKPPADDPQPFD
ncbi:MAG: hypothetical protein O3A31_13150 [Planctomycetota bacterium]|nr:hypothetical protein [Planctomycetota bacterium]